MKCNFKVGDRVSWLGLEGKVISIAHNEQFPVSVEFPSNDSCPFSQFTLDGRYWTKQDVSLKLISRAECKEDDMTPAERIAAIRGCFFPTSTAEKIAQLENKVVSLIRRVEHLEAKNMEQIG